MSLSNVYERPHKDARDMLHIPNELHIVTYIQQHPHVNHPSDNGASQHARILHFMRLRQTRQQNFVDEG